MGRLPSFNLAMAMTAYRQIAATCDVTAGMDSVRLINVVWIGRGSLEVAAAFEVEHSTSIYSGIVRMLDLALGTGVGENSTLFLVAPDNRRDEVEQQLCRPAFSRVSELNIRYLPYSELKENRGAIARFGSGIKPLLEISQQLQRSTAPR